MKEGWHKEIEELVSQLERDLMDSQRTRWNSLVIDLSSKEKYEVLSGLLSRQITLCLQFASNPNCWTMDLAPVILRCLADNYINFAWIAKDPDDRAQKFILFGLGQEKLVIEHRKQQMINEGRDPSTDEIIKLTEEWLNTERYTFLTEVNVGAWSGITTRQMAQEGDCMDFYNYVYTPFSTVAHNMWGHIAKFNLEVSDNPLHKFLKKPVIRHPMIDFYNVRLAVKYTDKMIRKYDEVFGHAPENPSAYEKFLDGFDKVFSQGE